MLNIWLYFRRSQVPVQHHQIYRKFEVFDVWKVLGIIAKSAPQKTTHEGDKRTEMSKGVVAKRRAMKHDYESARDLVSS